MSDLFAAIETRLASWWRTATATRTRRVLLILVVLLPMAGLVIVELADHQRERAAAAAARQELLQPEGAEPRRDGRPLRAPRRASAPHPSEVDDELPGGDPQRELSLAADPGAPLANQLSRAFAAEPGSC